MFVNYILPLIVIALLTAAFATWLLKPSNNSNPAAELASKSWEDQKAIVDALVNKF